MSRLALLKWGPILAGAAPIALYEWLRRSEYDSVVAAPFWHFVVVSAASLLASGFALSAGIAGKSHRNVQVTFLSLAFLSLASLFLLHGLSTPGFVIGESTVTTVSARLSLFTASWWLFASSLASDSPLVRSIGKNPGFVVLVWVGVLMILLAAGLLRPDLWSIVPLSALPVKWTMMWASILIAVVAGLRYWRSFVYSRTAVAHSMTYAALWIAGAQWIMSTAMHWHMSWWLYHFILLGAVFALIAGVLAHFMRGESFQNALRGLFVSDPIERLEAGLTPGVRALIFATEARDRYTAGHSYRVALMAVRIGQAMRLRPNQLRALAIGGLMHDVGKIEIPDSILNKQGTLDDKERETIQRHPDFGYRICSRLGFMEEELQIIRYHHERWDGGGYPQGLRGEEIPLLARIVAVADVYDALTSVRSYRSAWSHGQAYQKIVEESGKAFDPSIVEVWSRIAESGPLVPVGVTPPWSERVPAVQALT